ncbi:hypothetical protein KEM54_004081 [Ascosphaera aggregata]|nr:hypothetical protein KEM54_004081 [Ascosphaera aggregata]
MGPPRRRLLATAEKTLAPPSELTEFQSIARVLKATGNSIYLSELPSKKQILVEMPAKFRSAIWVKRGSFVLVEMKGDDDRENKLSGEIVNIVRDEKAWRKAPFWPKEFVRAHVVSDDSDDESSNIGQMPPSDDSD